MGNVQKKPKETAAAAAAFAAGAKEPVAPAAATAAPAADPTMTVVDAEIHKLKLMGQAQLDEMGAQDVRIQKLQAQRQEMLMRGSEIAAQIQVLEGLKVGQLRTLASGLTLKSEASPTPASASAPASSEQPPKS